MKKGKNAPVASSLPEATTQEKRALEGKVPPDAQAAAPQGTQVQEPLTEQKIAQLLEEYDKRVQEREDAKLHKLLDDLIQQMAANKPQTQAGTNLATQATQPQGGGAQSFFSDIFSMMKQFGLTDEGSSGGTPDMFRQFYMQYHAQADKSFLRALSKASGVPWHEVESAEHG